MRLRVHQLFGQVQSRRDSAEKSVFHRKSEVLSFYADLIACFQVREEEEKSREIKVAVSHEASPELVVGHKVLDKCRA